MSVWFYCDVSIIAIKMLFSINHHCFILPLFLAFHILTFVQSNSFYQGWGNLLPSFKYVSEHTINNIFLISLIFNDEFKVTPNEDSELRHVDDLESLVSERIFLPFIMIASCLNLTIWKRPSTLKVLLQSGLITSLVYTYSSL